MVTFRRDRVYSKRGGGGGGGGVQAEPEKWTLPTEPLCAGRGGGWAAREGGWDPGGSRKW